MPGERLEEIVEVVRHARRLPDGRDMFARLSSLPLPDGEGYVQGDVARVAARVFVDGDAVRVCVPAFWEAHLRDRVRHVGSAG